MIYQILIALMKVIVLILGKNKNSGKKGKNNKNKKNKNNSPNNNISSNIINLEEKDEY